MPRIQSGREYLTALAAGSALTGDARTAIAHKLSRYTGLPLHVVNKADLRIDPSEFRAALLLDQRKVIGRFDARVTGFNADPLRGSADFDPGLADVSAFIKGAIPEAER